MSGAEIICQVGFGYKRSPDQVYYHERNGKLVGHQVRIDNPSALLDPFDLEDLIAGRITYDLLPIALQNILHTVAQDTFNLINKDIPEEGKKLNPMDIEVIFYSIDSSGGPISPFN